MLSVHGAGNSAHSQARQLKHLHSRFPTQVVDVVPWFSGRVQETCWEVCQVCAGIERLCQSCTQVSIDVSQVWCISSGVCDIFWKVSPRVLPMPDLLDVFAYV